MNKIYKLGICLVLATFLGCQSKSEEKENEVIPEVKIYETGVNGFKYNNKYIGKVNPYREIDINSSGIGTVVNMYFQVGDYIKKDTPLVDLDKSVSNEVRVEFDNVQTNLLNAKENYSISNIVSDISINDASFRIKELEIMLENERSNLKNTIEINNQNIDNAEISLNNAKINLGLGAKISKTDLETSEESLKNFIKTSSLDLSNLLEISNITNNNSINILEDFMDNTNEILGIDPRSSPSDSQFEVYLGARKKKTFVDAKNSYIDAKNKYNDLKEYLVLNSNIEDILPKTLILAYSVKNLIDNTDKVLINSVTSSNFTKTRLDQLKSLVNGMQSGQNNINSQINLIKSSIQSIKNLRIDTDNQISILELNIEKAKDALDNTNQTVSEDEEPTTIKTLKKQLEITKTKAKSEEDSILNKMKAIEHQIESAKLDLEMRKAQKRSNLHNIKQSIDQLEGNLALRSIAIDDQVIRSPIDGTVVSKSVDIGDDLVKGNHIATIGDLSKVKISIDVPKEEIDYFEIGKKVSVVDNNLVQGIVFEIYPSADPKSKKFAVEVLADNSDGGFKAGSYVDIDVELKSFEDRIFIPLNAVKIKQTENIVFITEEDIAIKKVVRIGEIIGNMIEITDGLNNGDKVIIDGLKFVEDNKKVLIIDDHIGDLKDTEDNEDKNEPNNTDENIEPTKDDDLNKKEDNDEQEDIKNNDKYNDKEESKDGEDNFKEDIETNTKEENLNDKKKSVKKDTIIPIEPSVNIKDINKS